MPKDMWSSSAANSLYPRIAVLRRIVVGTYTGIMYWLFHCIVYWNNDFFLDKVTISMHLSMYPRIAVRQVSKPGNLTLNG